MAKSKVKKVNNKKEIVEQIIEVPEAKEAVPEAKGETIFRRAMGRHERRGVKTATIMNQAASSIADSAAKDNAAKKYGEAIHKPYGNE